VSVRTLRVKSEFDAAVDLQRIIWGYGDLDIEPRSMFTLASRYIGQTIGAFIGERLVGFTLAFATMASGCLHSHRVGVHPEYQNWGIGRRLKLAQREDALSRNISSIHWTFDPMQTRNAYFNLVRLGGIAKNYIPNLYGTTSSPLHGGLPTDRLLIEWDLTSDRVRRILDGEAVSLGEDVREILLPPVADRKNAAAQVRLRTEFLANLADGYVVAGFRKDGGNHIYLLEKS